MPVSSADLLDLANDLPGVVESEAAYRASASRAYYASYHTAREAAERIRLPLLNGKPRGGVHEQLFIRFKQDGHRELAARLKHAKHNRVSADYRLTDEFTADDAAEAAVFCRKLVEDINSLGRDFQEEA